MYLSIKIVLNETRNILQSRVQTVISCELAPELRKNILYEELFNLLQDDTRLKFSMHPGNG